MSTKTDKATKTNEATKAADEAKAKAAAEAAKATKDAEAKAKREADAKAKEEAKAKAKETSEANRHKAHAEVKRRGDELRASCLCACGCGQVVPRAVFCPGHDSRLASRLAAALAEGKTEEELRTLVVAALVENKAG